MTIKEIEKEIEEEEKIINQLQPIKIKRLKKELESTLTERLVIIELLKATLSGYKQAISEMNIKIQEAEKKLKDKILNLAIPNKMLFYDEVEDKIEQTFKEVFRHKYKLDKSRFEATDRNIGLIAIEQHEEAIRELKKNTKIKGDKK